jgi:hypothetical protein
MLWIPSEVYAVIDTDRDVVVSIHEGVIWKFLLFDSFMASELLLDLEEIAVLDDLPGFDLEERFLTYRDGRKLVWANELRSA